MSFSPDEFLTCLAEDGYGVAPLLTGTEIAELEADLDSALAGFEFADHIEFFVSSASVPPDRRRVICSVLMKHLAPAISSRLPDARIFATSMMFKPALNGSRVPFHQDLTFTHEPFHRCYTAWVPFVDTRSDLGGMAVIPGSHRWVSLPRPGGPRRPPTLDFQAELAQLAVDVDVPRGNVLIWDAALIHGSAPNLSSSLRPAVTAAFTLSDDPLVYHHQKGGGDADRFEIDSEYFFVEHPFLDPPLGYALRGRSIRCSQSTDLESFVTALGSAPVDQPTAASDG